MKKLVVLTLSATLVFSLSGCGESSGEADNSNNPLLSRKNMSFLKTNLKKEFSGDVLGLPSLAEFKKNCRDYLLSDNKPKSAVDKTAREISCEQNVNDFFANPNLTNSPEVKKATFEEKQDPELWKKLIG